MANRKPLVITDGVKRILGSTDYLWAPGGLTVGDNSGLTFLADVGFAAIVSSEVDTPLDFSIDGGIRFSFGPNGELLVGGTVSGTSGQILSSGGSGAPVAWSSLKTVNSTSLLGSGNVAVQPTLVSGTNIKTINGNSILGSGDLVISGGPGGSGDVVGPASAINGAMPVFDGTTGKLLKSVPLIGVEVSSTIGAILSADALVFGTINGAAGSMSIGSAGDFRVNNLAGLAGQVLTSGGSGGATGWSSVGDVVGPSSSTVRGVSLFADTTGKLLEEATGLYHDDNGLPTEFSSLYLGSADFSQTAAAVLATSGVFGAGLDVYTEDLDTGALSNFRVDSKAKSKLASMALSVEADHYLTAGFELDDNFLRMRMGMFDPSNNETTLDIDLEDAAIWSIAINEVVASSERNAVIWGTDSFTSFDIRFEVNTSDSGSTFSFGRDGTLLVSGAAGTAGQVLTSAGPGAPITWTTVSGGGGDQITVSATPPVSPTLNQLWLDIS